MHRLETIDLGRYRGRDHILVGFVEPRLVAGRSYDPDRDATAFGVSLARSTAMGSNVEIVRLDTTHGRPHLDRLFLPTDSDAEPEVWLDESVSYRWMKRFLLANWRDFVDLAEREG